MKRKSVSSSNLKSVGYEDGTLEIEFKNGRIYQYSDVPKEIYDELMTADSLGIYFNSEIRDEYDCERIN
ncbi:MAG: KTSC domain-containing protein [Candidatus Obscuribacterales bacterium]|nr:KTSC domain-containing protein [Candidatus Obscuribacterales bacterium]